MLEGKWGMLVASLKASHHFLAVYFGERRL